jgi:hypothetical protein
MGKNGNLSRIEILGEVYHGEIGEDDTWIPTQTALEAMKRFGEQCWESGREDLKCIHEMPEYFLNLNGTYDDWLTKIEEEQK